MLAPDYYCESIYMIPYQELWQRGVRALIFDLDNTLAPYHVPRPPAKVTALMKRLQRMGFTLCLLTNNTERRVRTFNEHLGLTAIHGALKPLTAGINRALKAMKMRPAETAIIGDQLFSDIWAGRNARIVTVLTKPISKKDIITVRWKRYPERWFLRAYLKSENEKGSPS